MPIRVKSKPSPGGARDISPDSWKHHHEYAELPELTEDDSFRDLIKKLSIFFSEVIVMPSTFEQLRTTSAGDSLRNLVDHLASTCRNPAIVNALLALKWHYDADKEHHGLSTARAFGCEIVAWRFLGRLSEREVVDFCLYEIPELKEEADEGADHGGDVENNGGGGDGTSELSPLLSRTWTSVQGRRGRERGATIGSSTKRTQLIDSLSRLTMSFHPDDSDDSALTGSDDDPTAPFRNLNALEIAAISNAKRFLSQFVVQKIITGIWNGDIIFWDSLSVHATKKPRYYNAATADPFSRLRVPKYLKCWEVFFFLIFLGLYYAVLVERNMQHISGLETVLYLWLAAFLYDEISEWIDAGSIFYTSDIWNLFDMIMIIIGFTFGALRVMGFVKDDLQLKEVAFDVLALEALFMIPRICSILSLSPYWGTLIPCLKEMGKDFVKFMVLVFIVYLGFLTTFSLVGRDAFTLGRMTMILTKIFFGSSYVGFDIMNQIDPIFGPPLMIIFITLTSILLTGSLTGILSNSFSRVITHAREEYLFVYSVYVLEASTSNRLTHFFPPMNLVALLLFRPLRLFLPSDNKFRAGRIALLKVTHLPLVGVIKLYERLRPRNNVDEYAGFRGPRSHHGSSSRPDLGPHRPSSSYRPPQSPGVALRHQHHQHRRGPSTGDESDFQPPTSPSTLEAQMKDMSFKLDQLTQVIMAMKEGQQNTITEMSH